MNRRPPISKGENPGVNGMGGAGLINPLGVLESKLNKKCPLLFLLGSMKLLVDLNAEGGLITSGILGT